MKTVGEVSAIVGYKKQYDVCAVEIYEELLNNNLEWVEFANANTGKLDDVLIGCEKYIKAFQVKDIDGNFTFTKFITPSSENGKSILKGCFEGWKELSKIYGSKTILAKYISSEKASTYDKITDYDDTAKPNFYNFKNDFWDFLKIDEVRNLNPKWLPVLDRMMEICNTKDKKEFIHFIKDFEFKLGGDYQLEDKTFGFKSYQRRKDLQDISNHIFAIIGNEGNVKFSRNEFLQRFGLLKRYETYFQHSFFVDEAHYQSIEKTINDLETLLAKKKSGYIALIGNAGSGKSTLLTKWLSNRSGRILKYYAYVNNEMEYNSGYRGEAELFLRDLLIQIREKHFSQQDEFPAENFEELQKQFSLALSKLGGTDEPVFIVVDGLDHIEREQKVVRSLIDILPSPDNIPENVYFILGSRTVENLENLPARIKLSLKNDNSVITISPLGFAQIRALSLSYGLELSESELDLLVQKTLGHPLFLRYTIEELLENRGADYLTLLHEKNFTGDIYDEYEIFWAKNQNSDGFIDLLGIVSRFRDSYFDVNLLGFFEQKRQILNDIKKLSEHYFFKSGNVWQFFHNSFKEFLKEKTAQNFFSGEFEEQRHIAFHHRIFEVIENIETDYKWNIIYHLYHAKEYETILQTANQEFFRKQWFAFRHPKKTMEDIKLATKASFEKRDSLALMSYFMSYFEVVQRYGNFNPSNFYQALIDADKIEIANSYIFNNFELLVSKRTALEYGLELYKKKVTKLPEVLLKRAEPDFILNVSKQVSEHNYSSDLNSDSDEIELMKKWATLQSLFMPLAHVFDKISEIKVQADDYRRDYTRNLTEETVWELLHFYLEIDDTERLEELHQIVKTIENFDLHSFYYQIILSVENEGDLFLEALTYFNNLQPTENLSYNRTVALVQLLVAKSQDHARNFFEKLPMPKDLDAKKYKGEYVEDYLTYNYDYSRLYYIITKDFATNPSAFITQKENQVTNAFYNEFAELGRSYAYIYFNNPDASTSFLFRIKQIFSLFHHQVTDSGYDYHLFQNKINLITIIIKNSWRAGEDTLKIFLLALGKEWEDCTRFWKTEEKQKVIDFILDFDSQNDWCKSKLEKINSEIFYNDDVSAQIENGLRQISLWSKSGENHFSNELLEKVMQSTLAVGYEKDYQLDYLLRWNNHNVNIDFDNLLQFINSLEAVRWCTSHANESVAEEILTKLLDFGNGFEVFQFLLFQGQVKFCNGLSIVLQNLIKKLPENYINLTLKLFCRIVLNFDNTYSARKEFITTVFDRTRSLEILKLLVYEVKICSVVEHKSVYLLEIQNLCREHNIDLKNLNLDYEISVKNERQDDSFEQLRLQDGTILSKEEVFRRITDFESLIHLMQSETKGGYFRWSDLMSDLMPTFTSEQVEQILEQKSFDAFYLAKIANDVLEQLKDEKLAIKIAKEGLLKSRISGWHSYYDGESKIKAFEVLTKVDDEAQENVFKTFSEDIEVAGYGSGILANLDKIFKLIDPEFNNDKYYTFINNYTQELLKNYNQPTEFHQLQGDKTCEDLLLSVVLFLMEFPSHFDEIIIEILAEEAEGCEFFIEKVVSELRNRNQHWIGSALIAMVSVNNSELALKFEDYIKILLKNSRLDIRVNAERTAERVGIAIDNEILMENKSVSPIYSLALDHKPELIISQDERLKRLDKTGYLRKTNDPLEYCHLYRNEINAIARESGFEPINIAHRIQILGNQNFDQPLWYKDFSEEEIRNLYRYKFDLRIPYRRPQYQKVWVGLMMVLNELLNAEFISEELADYISMKFDEDSFSIITSEKPEFISSILKKDGYTPYGDEKWVEEIDENYLQNVLKFELNDNNFILAEYTHIEGQGDGNNMELRQSFVEIKELPNNFSYNLIFSDIFNVIISDYKDISSSSLIIKNQILGYTEKVNWLAFNPELAHMMNLELSNDGNFRWVDEDGENVIESVYWKNNDVSNKSRNLHSYAGYGWYVVITNQGLNRLKDVGITGLYQHKKVERSMRYIHYRFKENKNDENEITTIDYISL